MGMPPNSGDLGGRIEAARSKDPETLSGTCLQPWQVEPTALPSDAPKEGVTKLRERLRGWKISYGSGTARQERMPFQHYL